MEKLTELLNKLLDKGWKPRNREKTLHIDCYDKCKGLNYKWVHLDGGFMNEESRTLRELVSKESGLWQFCCKNGLTNRAEKSDWSKNAERDEDGAIDRDCLIFSSDYEYWLIESALKEEPEIEKFLLENIKL